MSANKNVTVEAVLGDDFRVQCKIGKNAIKEGDGSEQDPKTYFLVSFGSCIAAIAGIVANDSGISKATLKMTLSGDLGGSELQGLEVGLSMEAEGMSREDKKSFLDEMDANLRSITHLSKNKLI